MEICEGPLPSQAFFGQYYAKVTLGYKKSLGGYGSDSYDFISSDEGFNIGLNGKGRSKAIRNVRNQLRHKGLEHITLMIKENGNIREV